MEAWPVAQMLDKQFTPGDGGENVWSDRVRVFKFGMRHGCYMAMTVGREMVSSK